MKRILVLGATGRTGRIITSMLLARGYKVRALGRSASPDTVPAGAEAWAANVLDVDALDEAVQGQDVVVTALSIPRRSRSAFAEVVGPHDLHSRATSQLLRAMERHKVQRLVKMSAMGVGSSACQAGWGFRMLVAASELKSAFDDHAVADALVERSPLDWTVVRPPILAEGSLGPVEDGTDATFWSWSKVGMEDVATWIVDHLEDDATYRRVLPLR